MDHDGQGDFHARAVGRYFSRRTDQGELQGQGRQEERAQVGGERRICGACGERCKNKEESDDEEGVNSD